MRPEVLIVICGEQSGFKYRSEACVLQLLLEVVAGVPARRHRIGVNPDTRFPPSSKYWWIKGQFQAFFFDEWVGEK